MDIDSLAVTMQIVAAVSKSGFDMSGDPASSPVLRLVKSLADGVGVDKAESVFFKEGQIAGAADEDIDLVAGVTDVFGDAISFTKIKTIAVLNISDEVTDDHNPATAADLQVGGGSNGAGLNAFDDWITSTAADGSEAVKVPLGGGLILFNPTAAGFSIAAGSDILRILNLHGADEAAYRAMVVGETT